MSLAKIIELRLAVDATTKLLQGKTVKVPADQTLEELIPQLAYDLGLGQQPETELWDLKDRTKPIPKLKCKLSLDSKLSNYNFKDNQYILISRSNLFVC